MNISQIAAQVHRSFYQERQTWESGAVKEFKIPSDTTVKRFILRVSGTFQVTHSGAPTCDERGIVPSIIPLIQVADQNDTFKNIDPTIAQKLAHLIQGKRVVKRYATGASAPTAVTAEYAAAGEPVPLSSITSTHYVLFEEEIPIDIEDALAYGMLQAQENIADWKSATLWDVHGNVGARVRVTCGALTNMAQAGSTGTGVTYTLGTINMELSAAEAPEVYEDPKNPFLVYKETLYNFPVSPGSQAVGFEVPKTRGKILGIAFSVRNSATANLFSDTAIKKVRVIGDNSRAFLDMNFRDLQAQNRRAFGPADTVMASGRHSLQGFAFANFRRNGRLDSGIPLAELSNLIVNFDSSGSSDSPAESGTTINVLCSIQELRPKIA